MRSRDTYETGFDESCGETIDADACSECAGAIVPDRTESACTDRGRIVDASRIDHGVGR